MKKIILLSALASAMLTSYAAHAAGNAVLKVTGSINPPSCSVEFAAGSTVSYDKIEGGTLKRTEPTALSAKELPMQINCSQNKQVAFTVVDNKADSRISNLFGNTNGQNFGLGKQGERKIGGYRIVLKNNVIDETPNAKLISRNGTSGPWGLAPESEVRQNTQLSFSGTGTEPASAKVFNTTLQVEARITKADDLDMANEVVLDGMATISLVYI